MLNKLASTKIWCRFCEHCAVRRQDHVVQFNPQSSVFASRPRIPDWAQVVFVADMFVDDYVGGAELTTEALIKSSPYRVFKLRSQDVTPEVMVEARDKFWIFGNFTNMDHRLLGVAMATLRYSVVEYDYKYCRFRSPEKHQHVTGMPCDCVGQASGRLVYDFYRRSMGLWWMSERQRDRYLTAFPLLAENTNCVLSSVFEKETLERIANMHAGAPACRHGWLVLGSSSWIKGAEEAEAWCKESGKEYEVVWGLPYHSLLDRMSRAAGFVYLPRGGDTCPRMVIEAKLLGCELHINDDVQHATEPWFDTDDLQDIQDYLLASPARFWSGIDKMMAHRPTVSGYTTTYNCVKQAYPFRQCIESMLQFCDEVCVVDGGSTDETVDRLIEMAYPTARLMDVEDLKTLSYLCQASGAASFEFPDVICKDGPKRDPRLNVKIVWRDWSSKRHPVFDGMQKAEARRMCTKEFCWQMDSDEVVHEDDAPKVIDLCRLMPPDADIVSLPVIEYWGGPDKVRLDIQPWKWRLSRNLPSITHGIPIDLRVDGLDGLPCAKEGTDGCDMIHTTTGERLAHVSFYSPEVENVRRVAMAGSEQARQKYEAWFNDVIQAVPCVFHYSWYDLERKIRLYRDYWQNHWNALWDRDTADTADNNMMFGVPWSEVTDAMISERATSMRELLGGWVWHSRWDGKTRTPHIRCNRSQPAAMKSVTW